MHQQHLPTFIKDLAPTIDHYGYLAVWGLLLLEDFGIPVPGETVLITAAFYAGLHQLNIFLVGLVGFIGAVMGDNIGFAIGSYGGHPLVERYGRYVFLTPERLKRTEDFFNRRGGWIVMVARFIDGLRQLNGIIAGLSEMRWPKFIMFNVIGAAIWVGVWTSVGYYGGEHINTFLKYQLYFTIGIFSLIILWFIYKRIKAHKEKSEAKLS